eukprot:Hpha_TRINITY_DN16303_c1_g4::TRINITY_DN16303_c1_g4_i1::g.61737::m.61737
MIEVVSRHKALSDVADRSGGGETMLDRVALTCPSLHSTGYISTPYSRESCGASSQEVRLKLSLGGDAGLATLSRSGGPSVMASVTEKESTGPVSGVTGASGLGDSFSLLLSPRLSLSPTLSLVQPLRGVGVFGTMKPSSDSTVILS